MPAGPVRSSADASAMMPLILDRNSDDFVEGAAAVAAAAADAAADAFTACPARPVNADSRRDDAE